MGTIGIYNLILHVCFIILYVFLLIVLPQIHQKTNDDEAKKMLTIVSKMKVLILYILLYDMWNDS